MGPSRSLRLGGTLVRCHLATLVTLALLAFGVARSHGAAWPATVVAALTLLAAVLFHEGVRAAVYHACGVTTRRIDLLVAGGSPWLRDLDACPRADLLAGAAGLALSALYALPELLVLLGEQPRRGNGDWARIAPPLLLGVGLAQALPALPMDAGRLLRALAWELTGGVFQATRAVAIYGHLISAALIAGGTAVLIGAGDKPYWGFAAIVLGLQLVFAGAGAVRDGLVQETGRAIPLAELPLAQPLAVPATAPADPGVEGPWLVIGSAAGEPVGVVVMSDLRRLPRRQWHLRAWSDLARPIADLPAIDPAATATATLYALEALPTRVARLAAAEPPRLLDTAALAAALLERAAAIDQSSLRENR